MNFSPLSARRALISAAALVVGVAFAGCSGGSNSALSTMPQANPVGRSASADHELARVTIPVGAHAVPVSNRAHAMGLQGQPPFHNKTYAITPAQGSCPSDHQCLQYHGGQVLSNTGSINVFVNPDNTETGFPNNCTVSLCPPAQWGYPGGFIGRYTNNSEMGHIVDQYEKPLGPTRLNRFPYLGYITLIDPNIKADGTKANAGSDAEATVELKAAIAAAGLTGDHYMYHLFYRQNQAFCSNLLGGTCYLASPFNWCAFHGSQTINGNDTIYSIEPWQQLNGCTAPTDTIQNDTSSTLSHELTEALTDPHGDAWWRSSDGQEIGDICRFNYSNITMQPNSITYNIQEEYINSKEACAYGP